MANSKEEIFICNGEFKIVKINKEQYDEAVKFFSNYHLKYENSSIACKITDSVDSVREMETLFLAILKDGVSFAAIDCVTKELAAIVGNKILCPKAGCNLDAVYENFRTPNMFAIGQYIERLESAFDIYTAWKIECLMEMFFLTTHTEYKGRKLATLLAKHTIDYARQMLLGTIADKETLAPNIRDLKPEAICAVFSSTFSQKVGENLGFETLAKISNKEFSFEDKTFTEVLAPIHTHSTFAALKL